MARVIVRHDGGGTSVIGEHRIGDILFGGPSAPEWRKLDAALVPYTSKMSQGIPNVSVGLDTAISAVREIENRLLMVEKLSKETDRGHDQLLTEVQTQMGELSRHVKTTAAAMAAQTHPSLRIGRISNPALSLDTIVQELKLNLAADGSYNDIKTQMGARSIQGAIETMHKTVSALSDKIAVIQGQIAQLNAEINKLRN